MSKTEFVFQHQYSVSGSMDSVVQVQSLVKPKTSITIMRPLRDISIFDRGILVTGRDYEEYRKNEEIPIREGLQYIEVGAGLGDFIPHVVQSQGFCPNPIPIVIDMANYQTINEMLLIASSIDGIDKYYQVFIEKLLERLKTYTNPKLVRLYNLTLEDAFRMHGDELKGKADYVVNLLGPYGDRTTYLEQLLRKIK